MCGDRGWKDPHTIQEVLAELDPTDTVIIHGAARGADRLVGEIAEHMGFEVIPFPAEWERWGDAAGPIRNQQMLDEGHPTAVIAFHNDLGHSKGTRDMVRRARAAGLPVRVYRGYLFGGAG